MKEQKWISVKDELPKLGTLCLCKTGNIEFPAIYTTTLAGNAKFTSPTNIEPEYWQKLR